jgi:hypothetical protein
MVGGVLQLAVQVPALRKLGLLPRIGCQFRGLRAAWNDPGTRKMSGTDAAGLAGRQRGPDLAADQHPDRLAPAHRQRQLAVLCRPADGVSHRHAGRRAGRGADAATGSGARQPATKSAIRPCSTGACAWSCCWRCLALGALLVFAQPLVATLFHYGAFSDLDVPGTTALAGYGVGLMGIVASRCWPRAFTPATTCARRCDRRLRAGVHAGAEFSRWCPCCSMRPGAVDRHRRADQRPVAIAGPFAAQKLQTVAGLGQIFAAGGGASALLAAVSCCGLPGR